MACTPLYRHDPAITRHDSEKKIEKSVPQRFADACLRAGLDLIHPFALRWLPADVRLRLSGDDALAILIGNSAALWAALRLSSPLPEQPWPEQPIDDHVEGAVGAAVRAVTPGAPIFYAHRRYGGSYLPFQRIAEAAGQSHLSPSHLSIHPRYGPWIALRAIVVLPDPAPADPRAACLDPCTPCPKPCMVALDAAQGSDDWRRWLAVRDACPIGREHRYGDEQIVYHYTKDRRRLPVRATSSSGA